MKTKPTRSAFLRYMQEAGHSVKHLDGVSIGIKWRNFIRSLQEV